MFEDFNGFLEVNHSPIEGKGLFTNTHIPQGTFFFHISGEVISEEECIRRENEENNVYIFWNEDHYIDTSSTEKIKYINHNCASNCEISDISDTRLYLRAVRDILPGEELTIDYGYDEIYDICSCDDCQNDKRA
jgi:SET domain-containing protein